MSAGEVKTTADGVTSRAVSATVQEGPCLLPIWAWLVFWRVPLLRFVQWGTKGQLRFCGSPLANTAHVFGRCSAEVGWTLPPIFAWILLNPTIAPLNGDFEGDFSKGGSKIGGSAAFCHQSLGVRGQPQYYLWKIPHHLEGGMSDASHR